MSLKKQMKTTLNSIDYTFPVSTKELEGWGFNIYALYGLGPSYDLEESEFKSIQAGGIGGGVYFEGTTIITPGEILEIIYNTSPFIINQILNNSGMGKFVQLDYIELDGK